MLRLFATLALAAVLALWASGARAQDATTTALARTLFQDGVAAADRGEHEAAIDLLRRSFELRPSPVVAFNLAHSLAETGQLVEAAELLTRAERSASDAALQAAAREARSAIEPRLARLVVVVTPEDTDAEVRLDDRVLATASRGVAIPSDPGAHVLTALRGDATVARAEIQLAEGASERLALEVPPPASTAIADAVAAPTSLETSPQDDETLTIVLVAVGVGVLLIGGGIALGVALAPGDPAPFGGNLSPAVLRFGP